jgi:hypothetical protein
MELEQPGKSGRSSFLKARTFVTRITGLKSLGDVLEQIGALDPRELNLRRFKMGFPYV